MSTFAPRATGATAEINRRLDNLIRTGTVAGIDLSAVPPRVRVQTGALLTDWLPWLCDRNGATRTWDPPTIGEPVTVLSPSGNPGAGYVLFSHYTKDRPPPSSSPDEHLRVYPDGARILYNHKTGALSVTGIKTARVQASDKVTVDCPESLFTGNVRIRGILTYEKGLTNEGHGTGATITGPITHNGAHLSSNGVVLHTHTHIGCHGGPPA